MLKVDGWATSKVRRAITWKLIYWNNSSSHPPLTTGDTSSVRIAQRAGE